MGAACEGCSGRVGAKALFICGPLSGYGWYRDRVQRVGFGGQGDSSLPFARLVCRGHVLFLGVPNVFSQPHHALIYALRAERVRWALARRTSGAGEEEDEEEDEEEEDEEEEDEEEEEKRHGLERRKHCYVACTC